MGTTHCLVFLSLFAKNIAENFDTMNVNELEDSYWEQFRLDDGG